VPAPPGSSHGRGRLSCALFLTSVQVRGNALDLTWIAVLKGLHHRAGSFKGPCFLGELENNAWRIKRLQVTHPQPDRQVAKALE